MPEPNCEDVKDLEACILAAFYLKNDSDDIYCNSSSIYWKKVYVDQILRKYGLETISLIYKSNNKKSFGKGCIYKLKLNSSKPVKREISKVTRNIYNNDSTRVALELANSYAPPGTDISKFEPNANTKGKFFEFDITTVDRRLKTPFIKIGKKQKEFLDKLLKEPDANYSTSSQGSVS